jgi:4-hydroxybenzoate polyprenyltransferase
MVAIGIALRMGWPYYTGLAVAASCAAYHVWLIRDRDRDRCFAAFRHNHWLGLAVFCGVVLDYAVRFRAWPDAA